VSLCVRLPYVQTVTAHLTDALLTRSSMDLTVLNVHTEENPTWRDFAASEGRRLTC